MKTQHIHPSVHLSVYHLSITDGRSEVEQPCCQPDACRRCQAKVCESRRRSRKSSHRKRCSAKSDWQGKNWSTTHTVCTWNTFFASSSIIRTYCDRKRIKQGIIIHSQVLFIYYCMSLPSDVQLHRLRMSIEENQPNWSMRLTHTEVGSVILHLTARLSLYNEWLTLICVSGYYKSSCFFYSGEALE